MSERTEEVVTFLKEALKREYDIESERQEGGVYVTGGSLLDLMEFCQNWRSEIEELDS